MISEFNLDNTTNFNKEEGDAEGEKGEEAKKVEDISVDYSLYSKFWQIQDFFRYINCSSFPVLTSVCSRNPAQCYQKVPWKQFSMYAADVLSTFQVDTITVNTEIEVKLMLISGRVSNWTQQVGRVLKWEIRRLNIILPSKFTIWGSQRC